MNTDKKPVPSEKARIVLQALRMAVNNALDKKRRLNQYAVIWDGEKPVQITGNANEDKSR
ncbi:MAG: hypothetical protein KDF59_02600 [Nitrosomonas sp.]|nr:hypothetical protein [Nitrosomonas sp.]